MAKPLLLKCRDVHQQLISIVSAYDDSFSRLIQYWVGKLSSVNANVYVYSSRHLHSVAMFGLAVASMLLISEHADGWKLARVLSVNGCLHLQQQEGIYWRVLKYCVCLHILDVQCHDTKPSRNWTKSINFKHQIEPNRIDFKLLNHCSPT